MDSEAYEFARLMKYLGPKLPVLHETEQDQFTQLGTGLFEDQDLLPELVALIEHVENRLMQLEIDSALPNDDDDDWEPRTMSEKQAKDLVRCTLVGVCDFFYNMTLRERYYYAPGSPDELYFDVYFVLLWQIGGFASSLFV